MRGGLALAVVVVGAMLAAATGVVGASVVAMGLISLPVMMRYGYDAALATGVITASGTLGQVIPPSVVLIVLADQLGISVGDLFVGSLVPGSDARRHVRRLRRRRRDPEAGGRARAAGGGARARRHRSSLRQGVVLVMLPPLFLILVVLGSIFAGIATPTEAGALGAVGAMILAAIHRRLDLRRCARRSTRRPG